MDRTVIPENRPCIVVSLTQLQFQEQAQRRMKELRFDLYPSDTLQLFLFTSVENANDILQRLLKGEMELAFINPTMVPLDITFLLWCLPIFSFMKQKITSEFQICMAATKALEAAKNGTLLTRNIHSELVLNLSAERNVNTYYSKLHVAQILISPTTTTRLPLR